MKRICKIVNKVLGEIESRSIASIRGKSEQKLNEGRLMNKWHYII